MWRVCSLTGKNDAIDSAEAFERVGSPARRAGSGSLDDGIVMPMGYLQPLLDTCRGFPGSYQTHEQPALYSSLL
jgi:hypothetical protein